MNASPREILASYTNTVTRRVVAELGETAVESVFLTGSVARNDIASFIDGETTEIHSDVDISVVVTAGTELEAARRSVRHLLRRLPASGPGYRIVPAPDVGVYNRSDLSAQSVRPGTVEIPQASVLYGRNDVGLYAGRFTPSRIDKGESLYLIENRLVETARVMRSLGATPTATAERHAAYVVLKGCLDAVTAVLVYRGGYTSDRRARAERWREATNGEDLQTVLPPGARELVEAMHESRNDLQGYLSEASGRLETERREVEKLLLVLWRHVAEEIFGSANAVWVDLLKRRCRHGRSRRNLSELRALGRRSSVPYSRLLVGAARLSAMSPVETLRLAGLVETLERHERGARPEFYLDYLDNLTRTFGWTRGDLYERGYEMFEATT